MGRLTNKKLTACDFCECQEKCADDGQKECSNFAMYEVLKKYENTGLTPAEVAEYKKFEDECISNGVTFSQLVDLMQAKSDGRAMILPCKVGDTVYFQDIFTKKVTKGLVRHILQRSSRGIQWKLIVDSWIIQVESGALTITFTFDDIGKTFFLSCEEAEKALKEREQNDATGT